MKIIKNYWFVIILIISLIAISSALIAEYIFYLMPCKMCLYQRHTYYFIILLILIFYLFKRISPIWIYFLSEIAFLYGIFFTIWHIGIEQKLFSGPEGCAASINNATSTEDLKKQILNKEIVSCDEVIWTIFGLSAATINLILLILILFFNSFFIYKYFYAKK